MDLAAAAEVKHESAPSPVAIATPKCIPAPSKTSAVVKIEQEQQPSSPSLSEACSVKPVSVKAMPKKPPRVPIKAAPKKPLPVSIKAETEASGCKQNDEQDCVFIAISPKPAPKARPASRANSSQRGGDGSQPDAWQDAAATSHETDAQADWMRSTSRFKRSLAKKQGSIAIRSLVKKSIFKFRRKVCTRPVVDPAAPWRQAASRAVLTPGPRASVANQAPQTQLLSQLAGKMRDPAKSYKARQSTEHLEEILEVGNLVYTHKTVSSTFQCGRHAGQNIFNLASDQGLEHAGAVPYRGGILLRWLPPLVVMSHHRKHQVICGNRRLKGLQAIKRWRQQDVFVTCVRYDTSDDLPAEVLARYLLASTTQNGGLDVSVRS